MDEKEKFFLRFDDMSDLAHVCVYSEFNAANTFCQEYYFINFLEILLLILYH